MSMDFGHMTLADIRELIVNAEAALAAGEAVESARVAVVDPVEHYASVTGVSVIEAWRILTPGVVDIPEPEPVDAPEFVKPAGAHDAYSVGDLVTFKGAIYRARQNSVVWSPVEYPQAWEKVGK